jgi:hypothetical protein
MTDEQMRDVVKDCGLDWHRGYMPLFAGDPTNRYAVLIEAVEAAERERCAALCDGLVPVIEASSSGIRRGAALSAVWSCARIIRENT